MLDQIKSIRNKRLEQDRILLYNNIPRNQLSLDFYLKFWDIKEGDIYKQVVYEKGMFVDVYSKFKKNNANLMYAKDTILSKKRLGIFHPLFRFGLHLREGVLNNPSNPNTIIWLRDSIALKSDEHIIDAYNSNNNGYEYYPKNIESHLSSLTEGKDYLTVDNFNPVKISKITKDYRLKWLFGDKVDLFKKLLTLTTDATEVKILNPPKFGSRIIDSKNFFATQMYLSEFSKSGINYVFIGGLSGKYDQFGNYLGIISDKSRGHQ